MLLDLPTGALAEGSRGPASSRAVPSARQAGQDPTGSHVKAELDACAIVSNDLITRDSRAARPSRSRATCYKSCYSTVELTSEIVVCRNDLQSCATGHPS